MVTLNRRENQGGTGHLWFYKDILLYMSMTERKTETGQAQAFQVSFKILGQMAKATVGKKSAKGSLSPITTAAGAVQILPS